MTLLASRCVFAIFIGSRGRSPHPAIKSCTTISKIVSMTQSWMDVACIRVEPVMAIGPVVRLIFSMRVSPMTSRLLAGRDGREVRPDCYRQNTPGACVHTFPRRPDDE